MSAVTAGSLLARALVLLDTKEVTLEKGLMDVVNVGSLLARALTSLITGKFTFEKDLRG